MKRGGCVYMITNERNTTLYTGITSNLKARLYEHENKLVKGSFSARYELKKLVYFEAFSRIEDAIQREKEIKGKTREKKEALINIRNPEWLDLSGEL